MAEKLEYDISVKKNELSKTLDEAAEKSKGLESILSTALGVFGGNIITAGFESFIGGFDSIIAKGKEAIDAAAAQEVAVNNLNNALARSGNFTKQASEDLQDFAAQLQATTIYEDDAILSTAAYLESLTNLSADGLKQATQASADLATVLGIDLQTATSLVAKSIEGNTGALKRYGIEVQKGSTDAETLSNVIGALNSKFGGAAASQLNTYTGSTIALKNAYGELLESAGNIVVQNPLVVSAINSIKDTLTETSNGVTAFIPQLQELINNGFFALAAAGKAVLDVLDLLTVGVKVAAASFDVFRGFALEALVFPLERALQAILNVASVIPGLANLVEGLENPLTSATDSFKKLREDGLESLKNSISGNIFGDLSDQIDNFVLTTIAGTEAIAQNEVKNGKAIGQAQQEVTEQTLNSRRQLQAELGVIREQIKSEEVAFNQNMASISAENDIVQLEQRLTAIATQKAAEAEAVYQGELLKNQSIQDANAQALANEKAYQTFFLASQKAFNDKQTALEKARTEEEKRIAKEREANQRSTFSTIATLSGESNKTLAAIGKTAALTQIAIDTPVAVGRALAAFPPPFNFAAAAAVGAAMAAQAARVAGVKFEQGGFVGGVNGASTGPDNRIAQVRDGEMILNAEQQKNLMNMLNSGTSGGDVVVNIDGREVFRAVRNQLKSGMSFA